MTKVAERRNPGKRSNASGAGAGNSKPSKAEHTTGNTGVAQCARLLARLRNGPLTTTEAQRKLDVYDPPARIFQLRAQGHRIDTVWTRDETEAGVLHRVGRYVLVKEAA